MRLRLPELQPLPCTLPALLALLPGPAQAHSFGKLYNLPVPFWMYAYGASAALLLSFVIVGYFATAHSTAVTLRQRDVSDARWVMVLRRLLPALRALGLGCLLLCIVSGLVGSRDPYRNFNMTFFWIVFVLGFSYLAALTGNFYAVLNPWQRLALLLGRVWRGYTQGRLRYPAALSCWPALGFYMAFIWLELFAHMQPGVLSRLLLAYTVLNLFGVWLVGARDWFTHCELFSVFFRLIGRMAPLEWREGRLWLRAPFAGLLQTRAQGLPELLFVLFMLSSTAYDGLHSTAVWIRLFWGDPFQIIAPLIGDHPLRAMVQLRPWYLAYESAWLLLSPFLYLGVYLAFIALSKALTRTPLSVMQLALRFAYSLLPIALVYNLTHYYTLILTQGVKIVSLFSDPFGWGWDLFGTAGKLRAPILPDMGLIWHSQVALILLGHIISVVVAHLEALRIFPSRGQAALSQLPLLVLMVLFTTAGLWILSQPLQ